jgi:hypothetical protein
MRVRDDQAFAVLAKDSPQDKFGNDAGIDKVAQHAARSHGRQLINIAEKDQVAARIDSAQQVIHQGQIDHRGFVDDDEIGFQWIFFIALKTAVARVVLE